MRRTLLSWTSIFALVTAIAGGCDSRVPEPSRRAPRVVDATSEMIVLDDADSAQTMRSTEDLIGSWTPPAKVEVVRPPPPVARKRPARTQEPPPAAPEVDAPRAEAEAAPSLPAMPPQAKPPAEAKRETGAPPRDQPGWYTPAPRGPHETAINVALVVGAIAAGMGTTAVASSDGAPGDRGFVLTTLGISAASFGTALVLHLTEPEAKPKAGANVTVGPLGVRGTF